MLGAHFDSWHSGTGATDNGAGSAVMMEAVRILKSLDLKLDRTVRIALWRRRGGRSLLGSMAYVKEHFGDPATMQVTEQHAKLSAYFKSRQRQRQDSRSLPAGEQRDAAPDFRTMAGSVPRSGRFYGHDTETPVARIICRSTWSVCRDSSLFRMVWTTGL